MASTPQPLHYLFNAYFEDDTNIIQTPEDKSALKEGKSAFFDVLEKQKESKLLQFSLITHRAEDRYMIVVDLNSGLFYMNGVEFSLEGQDEILTERKLIYFREVFQHNTMANGTEEPYVKRYFVGYEGKNDKGRVVKKVLNVEV